MEEPHDGEGPLCGHVPGSWEKAGLSIQVRFARKGVKGNRSFKWVAADYDGYNDVRRHVKPVDSIFRNSTEAREKQKALYSYCR